MNWKREHSVLQLLKTIEYDVKFTIGFGSKSLLLQTPMYALSTLL